MWAASAQIVKNRLLQDLILGLRFQFGDAGFNQLYDFLS
jgi:hypothetical protein